MKNNKRRKIAGIMACLIFVLCTAQYSIAGSEYSSAYINGYPVSAYLECHDNEVYAYTSLSGCYDSSRHSSVSASGVLFTSYGVYYRVKSASNSAPNTSMVYISPDSNSYFVSAKSNHSAGYLNYQWSVKLACDA